MPLAQQTVPDLRSTCSSSCWILLTQTQPRVSLERPVSHGPWRTLVTWEVSGPDLPQPVYLSETWSKVT